MTGHGTDHSHGDGISQTAGTAESENHFALLRLDGGGYGDGGQMFVFDFYDGQIYLGGLTDDARFETLSLRADDWIWGSIGGWSRDDDFDAFRAADDVRVGDDVAAGINDDSGTDFSLTRDDEAGLIRIAGFGGAVSGDENLHDAGRDTIDEGFDGVIQAMEGIGIGAIAFSIVGRLRERGDGGE